MESTAARPTVPPSAPPARPASLLESLLEDYCAAADAPAPREVALPSGRRVQVRAERGAETVTVRGRGGVMELVVVLTEGGARLVVDAVDLELRAANAVRVACGRFEVEARDLASLRAATVRALATRDDVELRANDSVTLVGERVLLNCEKPDPLAEHAERLAREAFVARVAGATGSAAGAP